MSAFGQGDWGNMTDAEKMENLHQRLLTTFKFQRELANHLILAQGQLSKVEAAVKALEEERKSP